MELSEFCQWKLQWTMAIGTEISCLLICRAHLKTDAVRVHIRDGALVPVLKELPGGATGAATRGRGLVIALREESRLSWAF